MVVFFFFFSSRRRHTRFDCDWSSDVCSSDLPGREAARKRFPFREDRLDIGENEFSQSHRLLHGIAWFQEDRKSVVWGKSVDLGGRRIIKKKKREQERMERW